MNVEYRVTWRREGWSQPRRMLFQRGYAARRWFRFFDTHRDGLPERGDYGEPYGPTCKPITELRLEIREVGEWEEAS